MLCLVPTKPSLRYTCLPIGFQNKYNKCGIFSAFGFLSSTSVHTRSYIQPRDRFCARMKRENQSMLSLFRRIHALVNWCVYPMYLHWNRYHSFVSGNWVLEMAKVCIQSKTSAWTLAFKQTRCRWVVAVFIIIIDFYFWILISIYATEGFFYNHKQRQNFFRDWAHRGPRAHR